MRSLVVVLALSAPVLADSKALPTEKLTAVPPGLKTVGKLDRAIHWKDARGDEALVVTLQDTGLHVYLATQKAGAWKAVRELKDGVDDCDADLRVGIVGGPVVTDLDGDGTDEVTFAYKVSCTSDVSASPLKLMLLEGADKYAMRGVTQIAQRDHGKVVSLRDYGYAPPKAEPALEKNAAFYAFAKARWEEWKLEIIE